MASAAEVSNNCSAAGLNIVIRNCSSSRTMASIAELTMPASRAFDSVDLRFQAEALGGALHRLLQRAEVVAALEHEVEEAGAQRLNDGALVGAARSAGCAGTSCPAALICGVRLQSVDRWRRDRSPAARYRSRRECASASSASRALNTSNPARSSCRFSSAAAAPAVSTISTRTLPLLPLAAQLRVQPGRL